MSVGSRLRILRLKSKRTLKEQSDLFGVSLNSVYRWEHDLASPKKSLLMKMAEFYSVPFEWLLHGNISGAGFESVTGIPEQDTTEKQLIRMFRSLSCNNRYKVLGYVERICVQDMDEKMCADIN